MHNVLQDLRFGIRQMVKAPGFAVATILTIALGIGATTSIFSLVNAVLLRPLPFAEPDHLVAAGPVNDRRPDTSLSVGRHELSRLLRLAAAESFFLRTGSVSRQHVTLTGTGEPRHLDARWSPRISSRSWENPALGRGVLAEDEKVGSNVVVLSHELWRSAFGSDPAIIGRGITSTDKSYTVIGVMPTGIRVPHSDSGAAALDALADDAYDSTGDNPSTEQRGAHMLGLVGRLKPGVSIDQAKLT